MALKSALTQLAFSPIQVKHLGFDTAKNISATGNDSQANGYQLTAEINHIGTVGAATNTVVAPKVSNSAYGFFFVVNLGANILNLYPYVGDEFNEGGANVKIQVSVAGFAVFWKDQDLNTNWIGINT